MIWKSTLTHDAVMIEVPNLRHPFGGARRSPGVASDPLRKPAENKLAW
jgi:hypothetical protein